MELEKILNILIVGGAETGKSSTVNALIGKKVATVNDSGKTATREIKKFESKSLVVWDTPGLGESVESDANLKEKISAIIQKRTDSGENLINIVLIVADSSSRDLGTEYDLISNIILPTVNSEQKILLALNQCDFAMKGKNWDEQNNSPNEKLLDFLNQKVMSVSGRIKESTGIDTMPIYYSALYHYNIETLKDYLYKQVCSKDSKFTPSEELQVKSESPVNFETPSKTTDTTIPLQTLSTKQSENANICDSEIDTTTVQNVETQTKIHSNFDSDKISSIPKIEIDEIVEKINTQIDNADGLSDKDKKILRDRLNALKDRELNIMLVGGTGVGKSSTINALFGNEIAKVGYGVEPQTSTIEKFVLGKVVLWDTAGLGDSVENDKIYASQITDMLRRKDNLGGALIDLVFVIIDASVNDIGTTYELLNKVIIPNMGDNRRILIALNQCDFAMKGKYWDKQNNLPKQKLTDFLQEKIKIVKSQIKESTGIDTMPIYYSALYHYNISKLFFYLLDSTPDEKRLIYLPHMNQDIQVWDKNDAQDNYRNDIDKSLKNSSDAIIDDIFKGFTDFVGNTLKIFEKILQSVTKNLFKFGK